MGILFPPLLNLSLERISQPQMAQASSVTNIIRQVGGSVGVCYFTYMLTIRRNFHTQIYSEEINYTGESYQEAVSKLSHFFSSTGSENSISAASEAKSYLVQWLQTESYISGLNDNFLIGCIITLIAIIPVFFISIKRKNQIKT